MRRLPKRPTLGRPQARVIPSKPPLAMRSRQLACLTHYLGPVLGDADDMCAFREGTGWLTGFCPSANGPQDVESVARGYRTHAVVSERREYRRLQYRIGERFQLAHPG